MTRPASSGAAPIRPYLALGASAVSVVLAALPVFLLGALAVLIREELGFTETQLGITVSLYYLVSALASAPSGQWAERLGPRRGIALAAVGSVAALLGMATLARSWWSLTIIMQLAALVNGLALSASNLGVLRGTTGRRGLAFGVKQSSGPLATLIAGLSVPVVGLTIGWRWAFVMAAVLGIPLILSGIRRPAPAVRRKRGSAEDIDTNALRVLAVAAGLAVVGGGSLGAFYVESVVAAGISAGVAGTMLAVGSVFGVGARVLWGWLADHSWSAHFPILATIIAAGAVGFAALGQVDSVPALTVATALVFVGGWGWPGIFHYAVTARSPRAPAVASGIVATGIYAGGVGGPVLFGLIVERVSYAMAWIFVATAVAASAALMRLGGRMLDRSTELSPA